MLISRNGIAEVLRNLKGNTFASILTKTKPALKQSAPPEVKDVVKFATVNVCVGFNYENSVNLQRQREGKPTDFEAAALKWGEHVTPAMIIHKGKKYLQVKSQQSKYIYIKDGNEVPHEKVEPHLKPQSKSRQGTETRIQCRAYSLDNIHKVKINGIEYDVA